MSSITLGCADYDLYSTAVKLADERLYFHLPLNSSRRLAELGVAERDAEGFRLIKDIEVTEAKRVPKASVKEVSEAEQQELLERLSARQIAALSLCIQNCNQVTGRIALRAISHYVKYRELDALFVALELTWTDYNYCLPRWLRDGEAIRALLDTEKGCA